MEEQKREYYSTEICHGSFLSHSDSVSSMEACLEKTDRLRFGGETVIDTRSRSDRKWRMRRGTPRPDELLLMTNSFRKSYSSSTLDSIIEEE
mmetsp:Transcript_2757/g.3496  ORF Transcript_2757/g.3496 Transcript_2757/m.3496 type:complete len:92 (+) Transcript_2757:211-486(+)